MKHILLVLVSCLFLSSCGDSDNPTNGSTNVCPPEEQFPTIRCDVNGKPGDGVSK